MSPAQTTKAGLIGMAVIGLVFLSAVAVFFTLWALVDNAGDAIFILILGFLGCFLAYLLSWLAWDIAKEIGKNIMRKYGG